jgi:serine/threonine protein kinase
VALSAGTKLGPYEILSLIGAGGMGEVYKARDGRLARDVAIKVLPPAYRDNPDWMKRFEKEARAAGALHHPGIVQVFDLGVHEGSPYVVTELLDGKTLRDTLRAGSLAPKKAVDLALQIAQGLAAAHLKGIVHRDIKPENLYVTSDGRAKILDFGLAKVKGASDGEGHAETMPALTEPGAVMGTVGYMSPEQVRGQPADARSDLFSFGVVLYEMLKGKRAFAADSAVEAMNAILKEDPPELDGVALKIPTALAQVVHHCLEKKPEDRFQSARDLAFNLQALSGTSSQPTLASSSTSSSLVARRADRSLVPGGIFAVVVLIGTAYWIGTRQGHSVAASLPAATSAPALAAASQPTLVPITADSGLVGSAQFTPDGRGVIYQASWRNGPDQLYATVIGEHEARSLGLDGAIAGFQPDGQVAIVDDQQTLDVSSTEEAAPRPLYARVAQAVMRHGTIALARWGSDGLTIEEPPGHVVYNGGVGVWIGSMALAPDNDDLALMLSPGVGPEDQFTVVVVSGGKPTVLMTSRGEGGQVAWGPEHALWYTVGSEVHARSASGGDRVLLRWPGSVKLEDVDARGRALVVAGPVSASIMAMHQGQASPQNLSVLASSIPEDLSPDGSMLLLSVYFPSGDSLCYLRSTDPLGDPLGAPLRLDTHSAHGLSPDGKLVAALSDDSSRVLLVHTGVGETTTLPGDFQQYGHVNWFPDGHRVLYPAEDAQGTWRTYAQSIEGVGAPTVVLQPPFFADNPDDPIAPDGKTMVVTDVSARGSDARAYLYPIDVPNAKPTPVAGLQPGEQPVRWSADGKSLFVASPISATRAYVVRLDLATGARTPIMTLPVDVPSGFRYVRPVLVSRDGKTAVYGVAQELDQLYLVTGLQ